MARISGVDLPRFKRSEIALTYIFGIGSTRARDILTEAEISFDKKIKGFAKADGLLTGVETRTSSPICIKRGKDLQSINTGGLYPAGEGAGYAGGIWSAGIDGIKVAEALALDMLSPNKID